MKRVIALAAALAISGCGGGNGSIAVPSPAVPAAPQSVQITEIAVPGETPASPQPNSDNGENVAVDQGGAVYFRSLAPQTFSEAVRYTGGNFTYTQAPPQTLAPFNVSVTSDGGRLITAVGSTIVWDAFYTYGDPHHTARVVYAGADGSTPQQIFATGISETASWSSPDGELWEGGIDLGFQYELNVYHLGQPSSLSLPLNTSKPVALTGAGNGGAWLAIDDGTIMRLNSDLQTVASFPTQSVIGGMASAADGSVWITDQKNNAIVHMTAAGSLTTYALPSPNAQPAQIVLAGDGAYWFTETLANKIGRITASGQITEYPLAEPNSYPLGIAVAGSRAQAVWARTSSTLVRITW